MLKFVDRWTGRHLDNTNTYITKSYFGKLVKRYYYEGFGSLILRIYLGHKSLVSDCRTK